MECWYKVPDREYGEEMELRGKGQSFSKTLRNDIRGKTSQGSLIDKEHEFGDVHEADKNMHFDHSG